MRTYDAIYLYDETRLDADFYARFRDKFLLRGFGYWAWKPQIIWQTFAQMNDGDILHYADAGCHLNPHWQAVERLNEYFAMAETSGILAFAQPSRFIEKDWTKGDLLDYFKVRDREDICLSAQQCATTFLIKKCPASLAIVEQYRQIYDHNFSLVDDTPSKSANLDGFVEHRHDQSVWSILAKLHNVPLVSYHELFIDNPPIFPVLARRDKMWSDGDGKIFQQRFIVNLTSGGKRLEETAPFAISTLLDQTVKPDKVILWLTRGTVVPPIFDRLTSQGLEIKFCAEMQSYAKLIPALAEFPDAVLLTAEDNVVYPREWFMRLKTAYWCIPNMIWAHRADRLRVYENHLPRPYREWEHNVDASDHPAGIFPNGAGGVLYPPHSLASPAEVIEFLVKRVDNSDIGFWALAELRGTKRLVVQNGYRDLRYLPPAGGNPAENSDNDRQLSELISFLAR
ncbi:hypothetical protein FACS1894107_01440 [Planctomycetales bacterium]|nr:hypothetical protein FACS1894107_01440 [Planctomycetales bacterium]GHS99354.1 hypothetical protein FACS1894108_09180 [Planctomycetales bacterium]